jgi:hypothetical protein
MRNTFKILVEKRHKRKAVRRFNCAYTQGPPKKCIHTLTDGICVLFSKLN